MPERRYLVKEMFGPTLQGEGAHAGRAVVFLRFAACNLACPGCDTDFSPAGAHSCTYTGGSDTASCTVKIASAATGTTTVRATLFV